MGYHETEKLLYGKEHHHLDKAKDYGRGKDFLLIHVCRGLLSKMYKELKNEHQEEK